MEYFGHIALRVGYKIEDNSKDGKKESSADQSAEKEKETVTVIIKGKEEVKETQK